MGNTSSLGTRKNPSSSQRSHKRRVVDNVDIVDNASERASTDAIASTDNADVINADISEEEIKPKVKRNRQTKRARKGR
jgi:hypothetical protein